MRHGPLLITSLVVLFFAEGQRALFSSLFALEHDALFPTVDPGRAILGLLPLLALLGPFVPLARWVDRRGAVAVAAAGVAAFRLPMSHPALETRLVGAAFVVGFFALFVTWAVGLLDRRTVAVGTVAGLTADQLLRLAGTSWDLSLQPGWLPVQAVLSLALLVGAGAWSRQRAPEAQGTIDTSPSSGGGGLERRAGGLRLRGALALGPLLFLDLHVLGLPPVLSRWTGVAYEPAAILAAAAAAVAVGLVVAGNGPTRGRRTLLALVGLVAVGLAAGWWGDGVAAAVVMAAGHGGALLLIARTLDPASGRRSGGVVTAALTTFVAFTVAYTASFFAAYTLPFLEHAAPWVVGGALLLLAGAAALLPQAAATEPAARPLGGVALGATVVGVAVLLAWLAVPGEARLDSPGADPSQDGLRVGTLNLHYGFGPEWRFEPAALRDALRGAAEVVALQEVPAGLPSSYGVDLPLWIGRHTGSRVLHAPTANGLLGEALLVRGVVVRLSVAPLPAEPGSEAQRLLARVTMAGQPVDVHAVHLSVDPALRRAQVNALLAAIEPGPAVVLGDLNTGPEGDVIARLEQAGFRDVFHAAETAEGVAATWPASAPRRRIDWILARGLGVRWARVHDAPVSDHRLVTAALAPPAR